MLTKIQLYAFYADNELLPAILANYHCQLPRYPLRETNRYLCLLVLPSILPFLTTQLAC